MTIEGLEKKVVQCKELARNRTAVAQANVSMPYKADCSTVATIGAYCFEVPCFMARQFCEQVEQWYTAKLGEVIDSINQEAVENE